MHRGNEILREKPGSRCPAPIAILRVETEGRGSQGKVGTVWVWTLWEGAASRVTGGSYGASGGGWGSRTKVRGGASTSPLLDPPLSVGAPPPPRPPVPWPLEGPPGPIVLFSCREAKGRSGRGGGRPSTPTPVFKSSMPIFFSSVIKYSCQQSRPSLGRLHVSGLGFAQAFKEQDAFPTL